MMTWIQIESLEGPKLVNTATLRTLTPDGGACVLYWGEEHYVNCTEPYETIKDRIAGRAVRDAAMAGPVRM